MKNKVQIHKVYEFHLKNLQNYTTYEQMLIGKNIADLEYIDELLDKNTKEVTNGLIKRMVEEVDNHTIPADILSLSAFVFKGKERGLNVEPLIEQMNIQGDWLISQELEDIDNNKIIGLN